MSISTAATDSHELPDCELDEAEARSGRGMWFWWARDIVESADCTLSVRAGHLLYALASHANAAGWCYPSVATLSAALRVPVNEKTGKPHPTKVRRARAELEAAGYVRVTRGGHGPRSTNGYQLAVPGRLTHPAIGAAELSTRGAPMSAVRGAPARSLTVKGRVSARLRGAPARPEVDIEVSRERARVFSPPEPPASVEDDSDDDSGEPIVISDPRVAAVIARHVTAVAADDDERAARRTAARLAALSASADLQARIDARVGQEGASA